MNDQMNAYQNGQMQRVNELKFCKDCKWISNNTTAAICTNPKNGFNLVTGERKVESCEVLRVVAYNSCSSYGDWFEAKNESV